MGARGHGLSKALFGGVTKRLVGSSSVPVLVGPKNEEALHLEGASAITRQKSIAPVSASLAGDQGSLGEMAHLV